MDLLFVHLVTLILLSHMHLSPPKCGKNHFQKCNFKIPYVSRTNAKSEISDTPKSMANPETRREKRTRYYALIIHFMTPYKTQIPPNTVPLAVKRAQETHLLEPI